jgi:hypothetical protein
MLELLLSLPDDYTIVRELRLDASFLSRTRGLLERRPDFLVIGPGIGVISIETKDWDLVNNQYSWVDQTQICMNPAGELLDNPWHQAFIYGKALEVLLKDVPLWVTSLVAFPCLQCAYFWNRLGGLILQDSPQGRMLADLRLTLFADDFIDTPQDIEVRLREVVTRAGAPPARVPDGKAAQALVEDALSCLIPPEFKVGDATERHLEERTRLRLLTEKQQRWAFELPVGQHCLFDLAGSGKTNVLVSRALHIVSTATARGEQPQVLLLTYSRQLAIAMKAILAAKLGPEGLPAGTRLDILDVTDLLTHLVARAWGISPDQVLSAIGRELEPEQHYLELRQVFRNEAMGLRDLCRIYDAVLIDEIQDFDSLTPALIELLLRGEEQFLVGDIAQRIHQRRPTLHHLRIDEQRARVPGQYTMYRCPTGVARVAHAFVREDRLLAAELEAHGYGSLARFRGASTALPELHSISGEGELPLLQALVRAQIHSGVPLREIMVVGPAYKVPELAASLKECGVGAKLEADTQEAVLVVGFVESKGLEAEAVLITGIESLPLAARGGVFADPVASGEQQALSRRTVYVAMTRTTRYLGIVYSQAAHSFVADLLRHTRRAAREMMR